MKKIVLIILLLTGVCLQAQQSSLSALFSYSTFYLPTEDQPYVETYLMFDARSLTFTKTDDGRYRATVEVVMVVKAGDSIVYAKKYDLNSPTVGNANDKGFTFLDMRRVGLKNGLYNIEFALRDKATDAEPTRINQRLSIDYGKKTPKLSSVQFMSSAKPTTTENILSRGGFDMEPYIDDYVPEKMEVLNVYYEVYNIQKEVFSKPFSSYTFIEERETGRRLSKFANTTSHESNKLVRVYNTIDIRELPTGNYNLVVEIHNNNNDNLLYQRVPFYRSNPSVQKEEEVSLYAGTFASLITDENEMNYYLDALYPIASDEELTFIHNAITKNNNLEEKQAFFYNFWHKREPLDPAEKWREYKGWLTYVDAHYSYPRTKGYRTDRGRVYLQYGPPDFIRDEKNFVSTRYIGGGTSLQNSFATIVNPAQGHVYYLPYQLWRYNRLDQDEPNRVFLFWDEFRTGYYKLLNSNAKGEVREEMWERRLSQQQLNEGVVGEVGEQFERGY